LEKFNNRGFYALIKVNAKDFGDLVRVMSKRLEFLLDMKSCPE